MLFQRLLVGSSISLLWPFVVRPGNAASSSAGCGRAPPLEPGTQKTLSGEFAGLDRSYILYIPSSYDPLIPMPLVVSTHGWGGDGAEDERDGGMAIAAEKHGFVVAFPNGMADNRNFGAWGSWNVVGSTLSPGPEGPTCAAWANSPSYCYEDCTCTDNPQCMWTTCADDVTPAGVGTSDVSGFLPLLYEHLCDSLCIDEERQYHTGMSNGAMATYQIGVSLASRVAAIVPVAGSFHVGFNQAPAVPVAVMDVHGFNDHQVPCNSSLSQDGWYYTLNSEIFKGWRKANGCGGAALSHWPTPLDGVDQLFCVSEGYYCEGPVVRCGWRGSHQYFANDGRKNGELVWSFLSQFSKSKSGALRRQPLRTQGVSQHPGSFSGGKPDPQNTVPQAPHRPNTTVMHMAAVVENHSANMTASDSRVHYGDPRAGCRSDEDDLQLEEDVRVCSPRKAATGDITQNGCLVGGLLPSLNGCPQDSLRPPGSKAWPVCLATGFAGLGHASAAPFGCFLQCGPCRDAWSPNDCTPTAHSDCPPGAQCVTGWLRTLGSGICAFPTATLQSSEHKEDPGGNPIVV